jgi:hypothetical protein
VLSTDALVARKRLFRSRSAIRQALDPNRTGDPLYFLDFNLLRNLLYVARDGVSGRVKDVEV